MAFVNSNIVVTLSILDSLFSSYMFALIKCNSKIISRNYLEMCGTNKKGTRKAPITGANSLCCYLHYADMHASAGNSIDALRWSARSWYFRSTVLATG